MFVDSLFEYTSLFSSVFIIEREVVKKDLKSINTSSLSSHTNLACCSYF